MKPPGIFCLLSGKNDARWGESAHKKAPGMTIEIGSNCGMATERAFSLLLGFRHVKKHLLWLSALVMAAAFAPGVRGQATTYTAMQRLRLQGFGTFSYVKPSFGGDPGPNYGWALGGDLDVNTRAFIQPGFELRATRNSGDFVNEYTYGGGPRVVFPLPHVQPYADFLFSIGKIEFNRPADPHYQSDQSMVLNYGGGADFLLTRTWAVKFDVQSQRWRLNHNNPAFHPLLVSVGVRYELDGGRHGPR
jgi:hypothetical protein